MNPPYTWADSVRLFQSSSNLKMTKKLSVINQNGSSVSHSVYFASLIWFVLGGSEGRFQKLRKSHFYQFFGFFVLIEYDLITRFVVTNDTCHMSSVTCHEIN